MLNPEFPRQFAQSLQAGGFVSQAPGFFRTIIEGVIVPEAESFAQVVCVVELSLGVALIVGALTNLAAVGSLGQVRAANDIGQLRSSGLRRDAGE